MPIRIQRDDDTNINLVPLIDVLFMLLIFFMVSSRFDELDESERNIQVVVPAVSDVSTLTPPPPRKVINVLADGSLTLDREAVTLPQLSARLEADKAQYQKLGVVVRGDANARHQHVADVIATCRSLDISDLNIAVRPIVR